MNTLQKKMVVFIFILSLGIFVSMFKIGRIVMEKKRNIEDLSQQAVVLNKKVNQLETNLSEKTKELTQAKNDIEGLKYDLAEEKKRSASFQAKYNSEKERGDNLDVSLSKVKLTLQEETNKNEKLASEMEKVKEDNDLLTRELNELKLAKSALEEFISEKKEATVTPGAAASVLAHAPTITNARIVTLYPQGLFAIELEKSPLEGKTGKIEKGGKEIEISKIHSHMLILEAGAREDMSGFKKNDVVRYIR